MVKKTQKQTLIKKTMLIISSCAFFLLLFRINTEYIVTSLLLMILLSVFNIENVDIVKENKIYVTLSGIISIFISFLLYRNYMSIYSETSIGIIRKISSFTGISYLDLIRIIGITASLVSLYFLFMFIYNILLTGVYSLRNIKFEIIYNEIFNRKTLSLFADSLKILSLCIAIGFALLLAVFMIPVSSLSENVKISALSLSKEGMYPKKYDWCTSRLDNSTDSIMLLEASYDGEETLIEKMMNVYHRSYMGDVSYGTLVNTFLNGKTADGLISYARYWHGYLVTLKPLLCIMSYKDIRILNFILQIILDVFVVLLLQKKKKKEYIVPYVLSVLMIMPLIISDSLQYSTCFYLMSVMSIATLLIEENKLKFWHIFLFGGIAVAYFDFLTYPIAVLGVPLVFYLIKNSESENEIKLANMFKLIAFWFFGYALMWFAKWALATLLTDNNIILDGIKSVLFRTSGSFEDEEKAISGFSVIVKNLSRFFYTPFSFALVIYLIIANSRVDDSLSHEEKAARLLPFILVLLLPIIWFMILKNHSMVHSYFTNKALITSAFALTSAFVSLRNIKEKKSI